MIYLDNAATSFPKPGRVIREVNRCLNEYCGNPGRSSHYLSMRAAEEVFNTREVIASHLGGVEAENIVFTPNATFALNLAIKTLIPDSCHVLCTDYEHNSVVRPLNKLCRERGIAYSTFSSKDNIVDKIESNTKAIVASITSNVTGEEIDLSALSKIAREHNLLLIIDASQALGHRVINLVDSPCDALCAPGHKALFGIQGSGFVYLKDNRRKESFLEGGSGYDSKNPDMPVLLPEAYEAGTLSTPAIVSLGEGVRFVDSIGVVNISYHLNALTNKLYDMLSNIDGIIIYGSSSGILSFNYGDISSAKVASELNDKGICVRGGLHCAPLAHEKYGTINQGMVRVSLSYLNKEKDILRLFTAIKEII